jgi:L-threonylcarbamoyladenylate synthase
LIAHISHISHVEKIAKNIPEDFYRLYEAFFPGPLTVVLEKTESVPSLVSAGLSSIALRMPAHPTARALIELVGEPLVAPSANLSGKPSSTEYAHAWHDFQGKIAAVVKGASSEIGIESTVVSLLGQRPVILRPGHITKEQIAVALGKEVDVAKQDPTGPVLSPGMKYRHYAPEAKVRLFQTLDGVQEYLEKKNSLAKSLILSSQPQDIKGCAYFPLSAKTLYAALRHADVEKVEEVLVLLDKANLHDEALMNRLIKAAENT